MEQDEIKYVFNTLALKKGDILLINTYDEQMHRLQKSQYDHAAIYAGDASIVESDGGGVALNHIFSYGFKDKEDAIVLRCITDSELIREGVVFYARTTMGMEFGPKEARKVLKYENTDNLAEENNRMFCSRLVALSYAKMGIKLVSNPDYCPPASFLNSEKLFPVENALIPTNEELSRIVSIHSKARETAENVKILVDLLQRMSVVYGLDIQKMEQLINASIHHPEKDAEAIAQLLQTDYYQKRFDCRSFYYLNDKDTFNTDFPTLDKKVWFLLNQDKHLETSYIPYAAANVRMFSLLTEMYPDSNVIAFLRDLFKDVLDVYLECQIWVDTLLVEIIEGEPEKLKQIISKG